MRDQEIKTQFSASNPTGGVKLVVLGRERCTATGTSEFASVIQIKKWSHKQAASDVEYGDEIFTNLKRFKEHEKTVESIKLKHEAAQLQVIKK